MYYSKIEHSMIKYNLINNKYRCNSKGKQPEDKAKAILYKILSAALKCGKQVNELNYTHKCDNFLLRR